MMRRTPALVIVVAMLTIGGCSQSDDATPTTPTTPTSVGTATVETTMPSSSSTQAETTTSVAEATPSDLVEPFDLVFISNSYGWGVADRYAEHAAEALGLPVTVHDYATGNLEAETALAFVRDERVPKLSDQIRNAEIIVVIGEPEIPPTGEGWSRCMTSSTRKQTPPDPYTESDWAPYRETLNDLFSEIWQLRNGAPTVMRAFTFPIPNIAAWREAEIEPECASIMAAMTDVVRETAEANGYTVVRLDDIFNGPGHDEDPREKGWIGADGIHPNADGIPVIADALAATGFEPTAQP